MAFTIKTVTSVLAGSAVILALCLPANAAGLGLGAGASVGGSGGVNTGAGASIGGSGGVNAGAGASAGGSNGVNAGLGTTVGGQNGAGVGIGTGIGGTNASNPSNTSLPGVVADMSDSQVARMKKRCVDVLNSSGSYDRDLRQLCLLISRR